MEQYHEFVVRLDGFDDLKERMTLDYGADDVDFIRVARGLDKPDPVAMANFLPVHFMNDVVASVLPANLRKT